MLTCLCQSKAQEEQERGLHAPRPPLLPNIHSSQVFGPVWLDFTAGQFQISLFVLSTSTSTWPLTNSVRLKANPPCSSISYLCYVQKLNRKKGTGNKYVVLQLETPNARAPLSLSEQKSGESRESLQITLSQSLSFSSYFLPRNARERVCVCVCVCVCVEREWMRG